MISTQSKRPPVSLALLCIAAVLASVSVASAQTRPSLPPNSPFAGGVPQGMLSKETLQLTVLEVIERALRHNLGVLLSEQDSERASGARTVALAELLPNVRASASVSRQKINLEAFGFPLDASPLVSTFPRIVGPFTVYDARVFLTQSVFDLSAYNEAKAEGHNLAAARHSYRSARDLVVLVAANAYLQVMATGARAASARAQLETADTLHRQAQSLRESGIVAGVDVIRAEVRLMTERQRTTASENEFQKAKLQLARIIGLPVGQEFTLNEVVPNVPRTDLTLEQALERAYTQRPDYLASLDRVRAAESSRRAVVGEGLPSFKVRADYGTIGLTLSTSLPTFNLTGAVDVPIFEGGRLQGRLAEADAELRERRAEAEDMKTEVYYDVRSAFLDLQSTEEELKAATRARELAALQLTQSRDRFAAGVVSNIEVVQAQEAVALASEQFINAEYGFNLAKAMLARSLGSAEDAVKAVLGGGTIR
jgi:outer membrane protein TolC